VTWTHPAYEAVAQVLNARTGLSFAPHRQDSAEQGIRRAMARAGITDPAHYCTVLEDDHGALDDLIVELTVGETYFFREPAQFAFIRREILPEVRQRRGESHGIRVWSAGCASGEEAYSLAIVLVEAGLAERAHLLATDISGAALAKARSAGYGEWSLRGEGAAAARPYLRRQRERYVLVEQIRRRVTFEHLNLALDVYPSFATGIWGMDLILCRNVLIYFDPRTIQGVARRLFAALAPGGWLLTASSDPPVGGEASFETVVTSAGVFYRRPGEGSTGANEPAQRWGGEAAAPSPDSQAQALPTSGLDLGGWPALAAPPDVGKTPVPEQAAKPCPPRLTEPSPEQALAAARRAFAAGAYAHAAELTCGLTAEVAASALHVRALANLDPAQAELACAAAAARHALSAEIHYLHAVLLLDLDRDEEAAQAARRVLYLDRSLAIAHFTLGSILRRRGDLAGARRAYRNVRDLCAARQADEVMPLSEGEHAGRLAEAAAVQLAILEAAPEVLP
jgi:chemotaxis protein methyltransferase CheR